MRRGLMLARFPLVMTLALAVFLVAAPGHERVAVHVYTLVLAAIGLGYVLAAMRSALPPSRPSPFEAALRRPGGSPQRIPELERMEREVALGLATAFDLHYRLRPRLRRIAAALLTARRGIELDASPEAARHALGDDAWEIVRPDREPPPERFAGGIELESLRRAVCALEAL
jgi:hypothetical protein